jgi:hypothetical protein
VKEVDLFENLRIWPNPTNGLVYIDYPSSVDDDFSVKVLDLQGKLLTDGKLDKWDNLGRFEIDLSNLNSGIYLIQLQNESHSVIKRIVRY